MNRLRVHLSGDRLTAEVEVVAGAAVAAAELRKELAAAGIVHGLDAAAIDAMAQKLAEPTFANRCVVARGQAAQPGQDGRVEFAFGTRPLPGHRGAGDVIDFHERALLHPIASGGEVARLHPPVPGVDGRDVTGRALPAARPKPAALRVGAGVQLLPDGRVLAVRDGVVTTPAGAIDVAPLYQHKGDVDLHSGNLHTHGALAVTGDLQQGFALEADGDVALQGSSFGGAITAGGSITVGLGIQAQSRAAAGGDIRCRHATNSWLTAAADVTVADELVNCETAADTIVLDQGRGRALGGALRARTRVVVLTAGSPAGTPTLLAAADLTSERQELVRRTRHVDRIERLQHKRNGRNDGPQKGGKFGRQLATASDKAMQEQLELARRERELLATASIEVRTCIHAGVVVRLGRAERQFAADCVGQRFRWDAATGTIHAALP